MESISVSSCSSKGSASETKVNNPKKIYRQVKGSQHPSKSVFRNDDSLRLTRAAKPLQYLDERRDDYFAVSKPMWHQLTVPPHVGPQYYPPRAYYIPPGVAGAPASKWCQGPHSRNWHSQRINHPNIRPGQDSRRPSWNTHGRRTEYGRHQLVFAPIRTSCAPSHNARNEILIQPLPGSSEQFVTKNAQHTSRVVFPQNIKIPTELSASFNQHSEKERLAKRSKSIDIGQSSSPPTKKIKTTTAEEGLDKLDLLCAATLDLGPLQENPSGCSCPKSRCIALYCDCFKAGRRCDPKTCSCLNCLNTVEESGPKGARSKAIQGILARNPRAFRNAGHPTINKSRSGEQGCNCLRSRCLKLYCKCFQKGVVCDPSLCTCIGCLNIEGDSSGMRKLAIEMTLEKRPDAFKEKSKTKILGAGCACKNNQCIRKYCECFRTNLKCTKKCSCKDCKNR